MLSDQHVHGSLAWGVYPAAKGDDVGTYISCAYTRGQQDIARLEASVYIPISEGPNADMCCFIEKTDEIGMLIVLRMLQKFLKRVFCKGSLAVATSEQQLAILPRLGVEVSKCPKDGDPLHFSAVLVVCKGDESR